MRINAAMRAELRQLREDVAEWVTRATAILDEHNRIRSGAAEALDVLDSRVVTLMRSGSVAWAVVPLDQSASKPLMAIDRLNRLPKILGEDQSTLERLRDDGAQQLRNVEPLTGFWHFLTSGQKRLQAENSVERLIAIRDEIPPTGILERLDSLAPVKAEPVDVVPGDVLSPSHPFGARMRARGLDLHLAPGHPIRGLADGLKVIDRALASETNLSEAAKKCAGELRKVESRALVAGMPIDSLRGATRERLRIAPLEAAGIRTVGQVLDLASRLSLLPGVGETTALRAMAAAHTLVQTTLDEMPVRLDIKKRSPKATELLNHLIAWEAVRVGKGRADELAAARALAPLTARVNGNTETLLVGCFPGSSIERFTTTVAKADALAQSLMVAAGRAAIRDPWDEFLSRPADFYAMLSELGLMTEDQAKVEGGLPADVVMAIRNQQLDVSRLSGLLRGYQGFAARFALVQNKVIIGDEMGLGKTFEALAVLAHLHAKGSRLTLVICPASVVTNWIREVHAKSQLRAHRLHGSQRDAEAKNWLHTGGVAVTTYESLDWAERAGVLPKGLGCVVVDEAHYVKNPDAQRSIRVRRLLATVPRALLLTGTPLENRLEEFQNLVGHIRPDLASALERNWQGAAKFRRQVAPVYLRRNADDVLDELPPLVETKEWLPMSPHDETLYRQAVSAGNFMAMRQAAMSDMRRSVKAARLAEIVGEAEDNGRRVIVFSFFRDVLKELDTALPGKIFGPLTGSVPAQERQRIVDRFSAAPGGAVLLAQIQAAGVGLNIQAASIVVICEPQLKPTLEWQAIARAHRMGQVHTVQVHRLLSEEGVDRRITEILGDKAALFTEFARESALAKEAPEAYDTLTEAELTRQVLNEERRRLLG